jgi:hypothetical protein
MACVYKRGSRWWVRYRDARSLWRSEPCAASTKAEAKSLAIDLE